MHTRLFETLGAFLFLTASRGQIIFPGDGVAIPSPTSSRPVKHTENARGTDRVPLNSDTIYYPGDEFDIHSSTSPSSVERHTEGARPLDRDSIQLDPIFFPNDKVTTRAPAPPTSTVSHDRVFFPKRDPPPVASIITSAPSLGEGSTTTRPHTVTQEQPAPEYLDPAPDHSDDPPKTSHSIIPSECGISHTSRIVGGTQSEPGEWPWLAAVGYKAGGRFRVICGGALISRRHVLSAQHCFNSDSRTPDMVRLGEYDLRKEERFTAQDFHVTEIRKEDFNPRTFENDIIILVLDRDAVFSDFIFPVCLPFDERDNKFLGETLIVAGWGRTSYDSTSSNSNVPLKAVVPVVDTARCSRNYQRIGASSRPVVDERNMCAGDDASDSCNGDSGGPLHYMSSSGRFYLVGIVSFGVGCADSRFPGVYTRVTSFLDWVMNSVQ